MQTKTDIRKHIRYMKGNTLPEVLVQQSAKIMEAVEQLPQFAKARSIALYHSLADEPSTRSLIKKWSTKKRILLPCIEENELVFRQYTHECDTRKGAFSIIEPIAGKVYRGTDMEMIVVPGMVFDRSGNRMGRGKGYYDRFLSQTPNLYKVGVCFPYQLMEHIPCEAHDIPVDIVITGL